MATLYHEDKAVHHLKQFLEEQLPARITEVNTDQPGLDPQLAQLKRYDAGVLPFNTLEVPRGEVEFIDSDAYDYKNGLWDFDLLFHVILAYVDSNVGVRQLDLLRYNTAVKRAILPQTDSSDPSPGDPLLELSTGEKVVQAVIQESNTSGEESDKGRMIGVASTNIIVRMQV